jgi:branched-chain amino acid transport system substrate-binding protein
MQTKRWMVLLLLFALSALVGCGNDDAEDTRTVRIAVLAPLDAGLTQFGRGIRNSVQLAVDQATAASLLPGWKLEVIAVDDSSDPQVGKSNLAPLLNDSRLIGVIGTYNSGVAAAVVPDLAALGIAIISPGNTNPALTLGADRDRPVRPYDNYFRMVAHDGQQGGFLAQVAISRGISSVAIVSDEKPVSQGLANDFRDAFAGAGGTVLSFEVVPEDDTDYAPYAQRAGATGPQLLFFGGEYDHAALLKQAAVAAGLAVPLMGGDGIQADEYITAAGPSSEGDLASSVGGPVDREPGGAAFLATYQAAGFEEPPSNFGAYAYDAANILVSAAQKALAGRQRVDPSVRADIITRVQAINNAALTNPSGTVTGMIGFDAFGDTINPVLTIYRVEDGHWRPLQTLSGTPP